MLHIVNDSADPAFNLACEEYFFTRTSIELDMFWRNGPSVIIGRNQNAAAEIDQAFAAANGIRVARRMTGGGAVFHDLGNINYTHIRGYSGPIDFARFAAPVAALLRSMGLNAGLSGRNDILIGEKKVSGAAQTVRGGRVLHHGTLLYDADLSRLAGALRPGPGKYDGRSIASVASRVANIASFLGSPPSAGDFLRMLRESRSEEPDTETRGLTPAEVQSIEALKREKYDDDGWTYGRPAPYNFSGSVRAEAGGLEAFLQVEGGVIVSARLCGDFFSSGDIGGLADLLTGLAHRPAEIAAALTGEVLEAYLPGFSRDEVLSALL